MVKELADYKIQLSEGNKENDYKNFLLEELTELNLDEFDLEDIQNQLSRQENAKPL